MWTCRRIAAAVVVFVVSTSLASAGPARELTGRVEARPVTQAGTPSSNLDTWGWVLIVAGAIMATTSVAVSEETARACDAKAPGARCGWYDFGQRAPWIGAGLAGTGVALLMLDRSRRLPTVVVSPRAITASVSLRF